MPLGHPDAGAAGTFVSLEEGDSPTESAGVLAQIDDWARQALGVAADGSAKTTWSRRAREGAEPMAKCRLERPLEHRQGVLVQRGAFC